MSFRDSATVRMLAETRMGRLVASFASALNHAAAPGFT